MRISTRYIFLLLITLLLTSSDKVLYGQSSVLRSGNWVKFSVEKKGVYKIDRALLVKAGIDPSIDPRKIKIFGNKGGMLPQANSTSRPEDLTELAIFVKGEDDGVFNTDDYILVYALGSDDVSFDTQREIFYYDHNLYADKNYLFLTVSGDSNGKRIQTSQNISGSHPAVNTFNDYVFHENDNHNELKSGREWFGEKFDITNEYNFKFELDGIADNSTLRFVSDVMAQSFSGSAFKILMNNVPVVDQPVLPITNAQYTLKGRHKRDTVTLSTSTLNTSGKSQFEIKYQYTKASSGRSVGYLDFFLMSYIRNLSLYKDQTIFRSVNSLSQPVSQFIIKATSDVTIWDVTDFTNVSNQLFTKESSQVLFSTETSSLREFVIFNGNIPAPEYVGKVNNQDLHGLSTPSLIIISNSKFYDEALRLANHRRQHDGISVEVVTSEQVFNEFASGRQDVSALRDFVKHLYNKSPGALRNLLIIGRSSYDFKSRLSDNTNFVTTYESRNSLHPLETYSSDDYFGFLEENEGDWGEDNPDYHTLDIGVGRIPSKTIEETKNIVDKLIEYDLGNKTLGKWRKQIAFVADDGDANEHQKQADQLAEFVGTNYPQYNTNKIFIDTYAQVVKPNGESVPDANKKILESLDAGSLVINYTGHGAEKLWAQERIFDDFAIAGLTNKNYPLFVTATCEFGRQDDPGQISSAELCVLKEKSGAIGMVTTARPVNSSTNFELNKAFYNALFLYEDGKPLTLGEIFRRTKNNSMSGVSNRNFSLLGDPSMTLAFPRLQTKINSITSPETTDTLSALSLVTVKGEIINDQLTKVSSFNGILNAVLYDKKTVFKTLGNENSPFTFEQWYNSLYRGKAEVVNGEFQFDFIVTKNIAYQLGEGKLSLYAYDNENFIDASGASHDFVIGKSNPNLSNDSTPPEIRLFMNDPSFVTGGITGPDAALIANIKDNSGVNISNYGIGNNILAILDNQESFVINDYYESDLNTFTSGSLNYPLKNLTPGYHTITVKLWDNYNNPAQSTIEFFVSDGENLQIEAFQNHPNPFRDQTTLSFTHNRAGDDLEIQISILDLAGKLLENDQYTSFSSPSRVEVMILDADSDFGRKLKGGVYLARIIVRSLSNGTKNEKVTKLIMLN